MAQAACFAALGYVGRTRGLFAAVGSKHASDVVGLYVQQVSEAHHKLDVDRLDDESEGLAVNSRNDPADLRRLDAAALQLDKPFE